MKDEQQKTNEVFLFGEVFTEPEFDYERKDEKFYKFTLKVDRLSEVSDYLPTTISEKFLARCKKGSKVYIVGEFRSFNKVENGRGRLLLTVFAKNVVDQKDLSNSNVIRLTGYLCKEPVYRVTPFNRQITDCLLAVNRGYNKSDYIPCIAWGHNAEFVAEMPVGTKLQISGRIQSREYQKVIDGVTTTRTAYEVSISSVEIVEGI